MKAPKLGWEPPQQARQTLLDAKTMLDGRKRLEEMPADLDAEAFAMRGTIARIERDWTETREAVAVWLNRGDATETERLNSKCLELREALSVARDKLEMVELRIGASRRELVDFDRSLEQHREGVDDAWRAIADGARQYGADLLHAAVQGAGGSLINALRTWNAVAAALRGPPDPFVPDPVHEVPALFVTADVVPLRPGGRIGNIIIGPFGRILSGDKYFAQDGQTVDLDWQDDAALVAIHRSLAELGGIHTRFVMACERPAREAREAEKSVAREEERAADKAFWDRRNQPGKWDRAGSPHYAAPPPKPPPPAAPAPKFDPARAPKYVGLPAGKERWRD